MIRTLEGKLQMYKEHMKEVLQIQNNRYVIYKGILKNQHNT